MMKNKYDKTYHSLHRLRNTKLQASRDLYAIHAALQVENKMREGKNLWREFFMIKRNRRPAQSVCVFLQPPYPKCNVSRVTGYCFFALKSMSQCS